MLEKLPRLPFVESTALIPNDRRRRGALMFRKKNEELERLTIYFLVNEFLWLHFGEQGD